MPANTDYDGSDTGKANIDTTTRASTPSVGEGADPTGQHGHLTGNSDKWLVLRRPLLLAAGGYTSVEISYAFMARHTGQDMRLEYSASGDFDDIQIVKVHGTSANSGATPPTNPPYEEDRWYSGQTLTLDPGTYSFTDTAKIRWRSGGSAQSHHGNIDDIVITGQFAGGGTDYATWISGFVPPLTDTSFNGDDDSDNLGNGIEGFFGSDPSVGNAGLTQVGKSGNEVTFTHPNPDSEDVLTDVVGSYQWSLDLDTWYEDDGADGPGGTTVTTVATPDSPTDNVTTVVATIAGPVPEKIFLRAVADQTM